MNPNREISAIESVEPAAAPPKPDSLRFVFFDPGVRNYLFAGFSALIMIFLILFTRGSDLGGLLLVTVGAGGMIFRWTAAPSFFLVILLWFLIFPFGLPEASRNPYELAHGNLRIADLLMAFSVIVYLASHYRVFGLATQAVPTEPTPVRKKSKPARRPSSLIRQGEIGQLLGVAAGAVITGQLLWLLAINVEIDVTAAFPFKLAEKRQFGRPWSNEEFPWWYTRLLLLVGLGFFGTLLARLVFGYWKLRLMSGAEGRMILQDAGWDETRRERTRIENWRLWG
ncbi:MAG TPA: hypothetical protein VGL71_04870, partial [Urbifossiella sp.]